MILDLAPHHLLALVVLGYLGFLISTTTGIGGGLVLAPMMMQLMPAGEAISVTAVVLVGNNLFKMVLLREHIRWRAVGLVAVTALPLAIAGAFLTGIIDDRLLRGAVGVMVMVSLAVQRAFTEPVTVRARALPVLGVGIGFISGVAGMAGPLAAIAYRGYGLDRERFVGTVATLALFMATVKIPTYIVTGILPLERLPLAGVLIGVAFLGVASGRALLARMNARVFRLSLDAFLLVIGCVLVYQAAVG